MESPIVTDTTYFLLIVRSDWGNKTCEDTSPVGSISKTNCSADDVPCSQSGGRRGCESSNEDAEDGVVQVHRVQDPQSSLKEELFSIDASYIPCPRPCNWIRKVWSVALMSKSAVSAVLFGWRWSGQDETYGRESEGRMHVGALCERGIAQALQQETSNHNLDMRHALWALMETHENVCTRLSGLLQGKMTTYGALSCILR